MTYLRRQRLASAQEIARGLSLSAATVRHHLRVLLSDGRIEAVAAEEPGERGRPARRFQPSRALQGDNLAALAGMLLSELESLGEAERETVLSRMAEQLSMPGTDPSSGMMRRLAQMVERLNGMHYQSRWEAGPSGPRIILAHCPYAAIIDAHPQLCRMDAMLLQNLLGLRVEQTAKLERNLRGEVLCMFAARG
jgi:predicted ArsR family transcriptional regulator